MLKKFLLAGIIMVAGTFALSVNVPTANAAVLENAYLQLSDPRSAQTGVTHDFYFKSQGTTLGSARFQYCILPSGTCSSTGASGASGSLGLVREGGIAPNGGTTFLGTWDAGNNRWGVTSSYDAEGTAADTTWRFQFTTMTNPTLDNCSHATPANNSTGTCYVRLYVYPSTNYAGTADEAIVSITVTRAVTVSARVDPVFTFVVEGVTGNGATRNGTALTTGVDTTVTTIPFGNLTALAEKFGAHTLTVTTNTTSGFTIAAYLTANLTGTAYSDDIDPFIGSAANQTTPQSWTTPTGTVSGTNTGWIGVGTDDTGVTNQASNSFYSLNTTEFLVASCPNSASSRITNVVYGIEVNSYQEADNYTGTLLYDALPTY